MTIAVPWVLWLTAGAMVGVIVAHLLAVGVPTRLALPTARFVPVERASAVSRARTPTDRGLLLLRLLALALAGAAFAGVRCADSRVSHGRLLVLDGEVGDTTPAWRAVVEAAFADTEIADAAVADAAVADAAALLGVVWREGPSAVRATPLPDDVRDALRIGAIPETAIATDERSGDASSPVADRDVVPANAWRGERTLAGALLQARRSAAIAARGADSLRLEVVTRRRGDATTAALAAIRATWPGAIVLHEVVEDASARVTVIQSGLVDRAPRGEGASPSETSWRIDQADGAADDPVTVALQVWHTRTSRHAGVSLAPVLRVSRRATRGDGRSPGDSGVLAQGGVVVRWPVGDREGRGTERRLAGGVVAHGIALVAPVERVPANDTAPVARGAASSDGPASTPIAWFLDGEVAIEETAAGDGCVRDVRFTPPEGDLLLDPSAHGVLSALASACGRHAPPAAPAVVSATMFTSSPDGAAPGPWVARTALVPSDEAREAPDRTRQLLLLALLLLLVEQWWRATSPAGAPAAPRRRP